MSTARSYLFVPGDSARKIDKALAAGADAVILDLEDSVSPAHKSEALNTTRDCLAAQAGNEAAPELWVRVNAAQPDDALAELAALPLTNLAGVFHPKLETADALDRMGGWLDALEARDGLPQGRVEIVGIVTETPRAMVGEASASLARGHARLRGYTWGTEDLSSALGRAPFAGVTGAHDELIRAARMHCLLTAAAAGVDAIDGISTAFRDPAPVAADCRYAAELGYVAKMAIHPAQLATIHAELAPGEQAIDWAERVMALVREQPDAAALSLDGRMVDQPHIDVARRLLARSGRSESH